MIRIGGNWFHDGQPRELSMLDSSLHAASSGPTPRTLSKSDIAHADVLDYVLGLNELAGEPVKKAHEIYYAHRSRLIPLLNAQRKELKDAAVQFPEETTRSGACLDLDEKITRVYLDCLEQLKVLWLTEYAGANRD